MCVKKTLHSDEINRKDVKDRRDEWKKSQSELPLPKLVFLDETRVNTGMTRLYARAPKGERIIDYTPDMRFESTSILSSVRLSGDCVPLVFEGALNGDIFKAYIKELLVPSLKASDIVIMDNLTSHKVSGIEEELKKAGVKVVYLPPYSPDLNPIEQMWSKIKEYLRKAKARTTEVLFDAIKSAFEQITTSDILGWFSNCGYSQ